MMRLSTFVFIVMLLIASVASAQVPLGSAISIKGTGGGGGGSSTPAQTIDVDGDGLYEYIRMPYDYDGDGTTWHSCDCGGGTTVGWTADYLCGTQATDYNDFTQVDYSSDDGANQPTACKYEGQRVWDDIVDDWNFIEASVAPGAEVEFEAGTYVMKGFDPAVNPTSGNPNRCWDSTAQTFTDECQTIPDAGFNGAQNVVFRHSGMKIYGAGVDANGFHQDLVMDGTVFVNENGLKDDELVNGNTISNGQIEIGHPLSNTSARYNILNSVPKGDCTDLHDTVGSNSPVQESGNPDGLCDFDGDTPAKDSANSKNDWRLCLDNDGTSGAVTSQLENGDLIRLTTYDQSGGQIGRTYYRIDEISATSCGDGAGDTSGVEVTVGGTPWLISEDTTNVYGQIGPFEIRSSNFPGAESTGSYISGPLKEEHISQGINLSNVWFSHVNHIGAGGCATGAESVCDQGTLLIIPTGFNHIIENIALIETSTEFGSGNGIDSGDHNSMGVTIRDSLFRYNRGNAPVELGNFFNLVDNIFVDNTLTNLGTTNESFLVRQQGWGYRIEGNQFARNFSTGGITAAMIDVNGSQGVIQNNRITDTTAGCIHINPGVTHIDIRENTLDCGQTVNSVPGQYVMGVPVYIETNTDEPVNAITIDGNRFLGQGRITRLDASGVDETTANNADAGYSILLRYGTIDTSSNSIGYTGIMIRNNYFQMPNDGKSFVVGISQASGSLESAENAKVYVTGNQITQGGIAAGQGIALAPNLQGTGPRILDTNDDGDGLVTCGVNWIDGVAHTNYSWDKATREWPSQCVSDAAMTPTHSFPTMAAADAPDCSSADVPHGTVVTIVDDITAVGTCDESSGVLTGGGTFLSTCACGASGSWEPFGREGLGGGTTWSYLVCTSNCQVPQWNTTVAALGSPGVTVTTPATAGNPGDKIVVFGLNTGSVIIDPDTTSGGSLNGLTTNQTFSVNAAYETYEITTVTTGNLMIGGQVSTP